MSCRQLASWTLFVAVAAWAVGCGGGGNGGGSSTPLVHITTQSLPSGLTGALYGGQVLADFPHPPGLFLITGGDLPAGLTLDSAEGKIQGYPKKSGVFRFQVAARDGPDPSLPKDRDVVFDQDVREFTVSIGLGPPNIIPQSLPVAQYRTSYSYTIDVRGGVAPYTFEWVGGDALPDGLQLTSDGTIAGVPTKSEKHPYVFEVRVTDHDGAQDTDSLGLEVVIQPLTILTASIPQAGVGVPYDVALVLSSQGGGDPIVWSQAIPVGLGETNLADIGMTLSSGGHVQDTGAGPTTLGTYLFTAQVTDAAGQLATRQYTLKVVSTPVIASVTPNKSTLPGPFTVSGFNFISGATLSFLRAGAGPTITPTFVNANTLTFPAPPPGPGGPVDLKVTNPDGGTYTKKAAILYPITNVSFGAKGLVSSALSSSGLAVGDLDGDGYADIVHSGTSGVSAYNGGPTSTAAGLVYLRNVGGGSSWSATTLDSSNWFDVKIADMNTDGAPDIVAVGANGIRVWFNSPSNLGTFTASGLTPLPSGVAWPSEMVVALLTPDLVPDVAFAVGHVQSGSVYSYQGNGAGGFSLLSSNTTFLGGGLYGVLSLAAGDTTGDGRPDLHAATGYTNLFTNAPVWWRCVTNADGTMGSWTSSSESMFLWGNTTGVAVGDVLGTGSPALIASSVQDAGDGGGRKLQVFPGANPGNGPTTLAQTTSWGKYIAVGDLDMDSRQDFVMSMHSGMLLVYRGSAVGSNSSPSFSFDVTSGAPTVSSARTGHVAIGDVNGDGLNDILVTTSYFAADTQPNLNGTIYALNLAGNGNPMGIVYYLNTSN